MSAYAFARLRFRGREQLFVLFLGTLMVPQEVLIVPMYWLMQSLGWVDSYWALILPWAFTAFGTFLLRQFFLTVPAELEEAARVDGCGPFGSFLRIMLPLARPAIAVLTVFTFISFWGSFLWPLIIINSVEDKGTVPLGLAQFIGQQGTQWNLMMAASDAWRCCPPSCSSSCCRNTSSAASSSPGWAAGESLLLQGVADMTDAPPASSVEKFRDWRFGLFVHWGLYSLPARHEWVKNRERLTDEDYQQYFDHFDPDLYDPREWADAAAEAGMKYAVLTTQAPRGLLPVGLRADRLHGHEDRRGARTWSARSSRPAGPRGSASASTTR